MTKVLIAEDDLMTADFLEEILVEAGYTVCGVATTVQQAVTLGNAYQPELAILDVRLKNGGRGTDIVPLLTHAGNVGILYATGCSRSEQMENGHVYICKPFSGRDLLRALRLVQQIVAGTGLPSSVPPGACVLV